MKSDAQFLADLHQSHATVERVAAWLARRGYVVSVPDLVVRPDAAHRTAYRDNGDLLLTQRIEVKHRRVRFTSADDYPYPTIYVDERYHLTPDRLVGTAGYAIVNADQTHVALVSARTARQWGTERRFDPAQQRDADFATCPLDLVTFCSLATGGLP